jgi:hypothetical protein
MGPFHAKIFVVGRFVRVTFFAAAAFLSILSDFARGQTVEFDDWQGFKEGSWCEIRTTVETIDKQGAVDSRGTTTARMILGAVTKDAVTLNVAEGTVEYAGKPFPTPASTLVLRQYGQSESDEISVAEQPKVSFELGEKKFECRSIKAVLTGEKGNREVVTLFVDASVNSPMRRIAKSFDADGKLVDTTTTEVVSMESAVHVRDRPRPAIHYRVVYRNHKVSSTTFVVKCAEVPGQVVRATVVERGADGKLVRFTSQELVDFYVPTDNVQGTEIGGRPRDRREDRREDRRNRR